MTFRIFDDEARKLISQHVLGSMPVVPNRHGSNMGTDLLVQGADTPREYNPDPGGEYDPYGGGGSGGGGGPPGKRPGGQRLPVDISCKAEPVSHNGSCPPPFKEDGKTFHFIKKGNAGSEYCCAVERAEGAGPPITPPNSGTGSPCPPGHRRHWQIQYQRGTEDTPNNNPPYHGRTINQFIAESGRGLPQGSEISTVFQIGSNIIRTTRCDPIPATEQPPSTPPPITLIPHGPIETKEYDGDDKTSTPQAPPKNQIVFRARPIADIPAGGLGWCQTSMDLISVDKNGNCSKAGGATLVPSKDIEGLPTECKQSKNVPMIFARNPSASVIERGVTVIAVRDSSGTFAGVQRATIVVVPCST